MVSIANDFVINGVHCVEVFSVFGIMHNRFEVIVRIPTLTRAYVISGSRYVLWLPGGINTIQMDAYVWSFPSGWGVVLVARFARCRAADWQLGDAALALVVIIIVFL